MHNYDLRWLVVLNIFQTVILVGILWNTVK